MKKRFEEELSKLAFGDLDAEEARRLEMRTASDPEASQTFQSYCRMKDELRSLADDVPADQLSKERLREAILNRGMKEQLPQKAKPTWIWMPAMAAALAFGVVFVKGQLPLGGQPSAVVVDNSTSTLGGKAPKIDVPPVTVPDPVVAKHRKSNLVKDTPSMQVASNVGAARNDRTNDNFSDSRNRASKEGFSGIPLGAADLEKAVPIKEEELTQTVSFDSGTKGEIGSREQSKPSAAMMAAPAGDSAPKPTIILIQSETDADTGTLKAKEVSNTNNVVIGG